MQCGEISITCTHEIIQLILPFIEWREFLSVNYAFHSLIKESFWSSSSTKLVDEFECYGRSYYILLQKYGLQLTRKTLRFGFQRNVRIYENGCSTTRVITTNDDIIDPLCINNDITTEGHLASINENYTNNLDLVEIVSSRITNNLLLSIFNNSISTITEIKFLGDNIRLSPSFLLELFEKLSKNWSMISALKIIHLPGSLIENNTFWYSMASKLIYFPNIEQIFITAIRGFNYGENCFDNLSINMFPNLTRLDIKKSSSIHINFISKILHSSGNRLEHLCLRGVKFMMSND